MNKEQIYDLIRNPIVTEKATLASQHNKYVFQVDKSSNKHQIKGAIEQIFGVTVTKVNIVNVMGKTKRFRGFKGKRNDYKKAIISLADGQVIDISVGA